MRHVVLIAGPPCSGKSQLAQQLARANPGIVLDRDVIAQGLGSTQGWMHDEATTQQAEQIMLAEIARIAEAHDITAYVVRSVPAPAQRMALAEELKASVVYLLNPGIGECMRRATEDDRPRGTHGGIRAWYQRYRPCGVDRAPHQPKLITSRSW